MFSCKSSLKLIKLRASKNCLSDSQVLGLSVTAWLTSHGLGPSCEVAYTKPTQSIVIYEVAYSLARSHTCILRSHTCILRGHITFVLKNKQTDLDCCCHQIMYQQYTISSSSPSRKVRIGALHNLSFNA